jgi:hypothetical protein
MGPPRQVPSLFPLRTSLAAAFLLLFLPLTLPVLTWKVFPFGDMSAFHVPMRFLYREALRAGDTFLWTPWLESGLYIHAEGQTGMAHPLHLLTYRFLPLTLAINLEMLSAYAFALAGMWLLLRRLGIRSEAAFGGAMTFAFGGFMLPHLNHLTAIVVAAHIPWVVLASDRLLGGSAWGFAGVALLLGSQVLLGFPQIVWMTGLVVGWLAVYRFVTGTPPARVLLLACALILGLMIGGVQMLPTLDAARDSFRSATTAAFRMSFSLHPLNLVQLFSPYVLKDGVYAVTADEQFPHELSLYDGALATLSAAWILARRRSLPRPDLATAFLCLAAAGLVLALGRYGGLYWLISRLPILSSFRASARHVLIVHFALAGLVAVTLQDLIERPARAPVPRWPLVVPLAISAALTAGALVAASWGAAHGIAVGTAAAAIGGLAFMVVTALCLSRAARGSRHAVGALVLIAAADLACWGLPYAYAEAPRGIGLEPARGRPRGSQPGDKVHPEHDLGQMNRYPMVRRPSQLAYLGIARASVLDPDALVTQRLAGVKWTWTPTGWIAVDGPMPRVRLVTEWRTSHDMPRDLETIDIARTALVDGSPGATDAPAGDAQLVDDRPGRLRIVARAGAEQLLVVAERYHPGWIARVDGAEAQARPVYGDYLGCVTPAGSHTVDLVFAPASARYGLWLTLGGLGLTVIGALLVARTHRRPAS